MDFRSVASLDGRSIAFSRVLSGLVVVADVLDRCGSLAAHYTDIGATPRAFLTLSVHHRLCLHCMSGLYEVLALLMALHVLVALAWTLGYRTRLSGFLTLLLTLSLHARSPHTVHGSDVILRLVLFFLLFTPAGSHYSIDAALKAREAWAAGAGGGEGEGEGEEGAALSPSPPAVLSSLSPARVSETTSAACLAQRVELALVYLCAGLHKTGPDWWTDLTAVFHILENPTYIARPAVYFRDAVPFQATRAITAMTMVLELLGWALFLVPHRTWGPRCAILGVLLFLSFHFGLGLCMSLFIFPYTDAAQLVACLPASAWEWAAGRTVDADAQRRLVVHVAGARGRGRGGKGGQDGTGQQPRGGRGLVALLRGLVASLAAAVPWVAVELLILPHVRVAAGKEAEEGGGGSAWLVVVQEGEGDGEQGEAGAGGGRRDEHGVGGPPPSRRGLAAHRTASCGVGAGCGSWERGRRYSKGGDHLLFVDCATGQPGPGPSGAGPPGAPRRCRG
jgi:hypothetical protein